MRTILRIVVPTDFSDCSAEALHHAVKLARQFGARIDLLYVIDQLSGRALGVEVSQSRQHLRDTLYREAQANLAAFVPRLAGIDHDVVIRTGRPSSAIVAYAEEVDADLIVIATHGRSGFARLFIGSTTEEVVRKSRVPVLTVCPHHETRHSHGACVTHEADCDCRRETVNYRTLVAVRGAPVRVRDAMRRDVVSVLPSTPVLEIVDLLIHHDFSGVPVVDNDDVLLGYIPESHLLKRSLSAIADRFHESEEGATVEDLLEHQRHVHGLEARDVMRPLADVTTVDDSAFLSDAIRIMLRHHVSRLPVVRGQKLVGYLTRADILRVFRSLAEHKERPCDDHEVARLVQQALDRSNDLALSNLQIHTRDGVVTIKGMVTSAEEIEHANHIIERVPGVKSIENCLLIEHLLH